MGGCFSSLEERQQKKRTQSIDAALKKDAERLLTEVKILLLGAGESGKSTIVKQMKIIHQNGYSEDELRSFKRTIFKNVVDCSKALVLAMQHFEISPAHSNGKATMQTILDYKFTEDSPPGLPFFKAVDQLWKDEVMKDVMLKSHEFYLMDSAPYFFDHALRIAEPSYMPDTQDVLRARTKTTGIYDTRFTMGNLSIHMFDVGGQRSERKKWIHCFEGVTSIIFCVALSEYDQTLLEEAGENRMAESMALFESVVNARWFLRTSIILFLNKVDLFKEKLDRNPMKNYFPEYEGGNNINKAARYLLFRFNLLNRQRLNIYPHLTQATDTDNIRKVFAAVRETTLQNTLREVGLLR